MSTVPVDPILEGCEALARRLLWLAMQDTQRGDAQARAWLTSSEARFWIELAGFDRPPDLTQMRSTLTTQD